MKAWEHIELQKAKARGRIEIDRENVRPAWITEESRIMLADTSLMDDEAKMFTNMHKDINERNKSA